MSVLYTKIMPEDEPQPDPRTVLHELQATTLPDSDKDNALEGFINLYDAMHSPANGEYQPNPRDEVILSNFIATFAEQIENDERLEKLVTQVEEKL